MFGIPRGTEGNQRKPKGSNGNPKEPTGTKGSQRENIIVRARPPKGTKGKLTNEIAN